ncbi:amino acid ABC transporter permease [uncultured Alsobacter sp.]|uniref:amino acid ABC transporter permease n=1 Tax=uncultured Alsobacter sp. TaxID=1748258 RepID=UPI0025FE52AC|nr:amino acid ABC transporter permease [uncultured Alsobacter sp.]
MTYTFQFGQILGYWPQLLNGALLTIKLSAFAMVFGLIIGVVCALARTYGNAAASWAAAGYVEFIRNTPFLIQLYFVFFALPNFGIRLDSNTAALVAMSINLGAYSTEIVRAGLESVPTGQIEAGRSLGLKRLQIIRFIILLPAIRAVYPALCSQFILTLLGSSVVSAIAAEELTAFANTLNMQTFRSFEIYLIVTVLYIAMAFAFRAIFAGVHHLVFANRG